LRFAALSVAAAALALGLPARADPPIPATVADLMGARGLSIGAYRGLAAGNDGVFTNAASLAARRRFSAETLWLLDHDQGGTNLHMLGGTVVDSQTVAVTGGAAYLRLLGGQWTGNSVFIPLAIPVTSSIFLGITGKYNNLSGPGGDSINALNMDASAFWQVTRLISLGASGYNLISSGHPQLQPRAVGAGLAFGDDTRYHLLADWRGDLSRKGKLTHLFAVGGELLLGGSFPVRAGYVRDETRNSNFWSVGAGYVTDTGFAIDVGYRGRIESPTNFTIAVALKFFFQQ
jgi:hypothetical protein